MSETPRMGLPLLEAAQAQKHVTHNDALEILDAIVQLSVKDRNLTAPPGSPAEGDRYIPAATATGAWAGQEGNIAHFVGGAWEFYTPREGWRAWVDDEDVLLRYDGAAWAEYTATLTLLGVGATADATNPFSAKLNNALLTAKYAAEGGDGDLRVKANKEAAADTVSYLFQTNFSGRAEFGLIGNDDFAVKVSPDGSAWTTALSIDKTTGKVTVASLSAPNVETLGESEINHQSGTSYTLALTDKGKIVEMDNAAANTLTVPPNSSVAFPVGTRADLVQVGAGQTSIAAGVGVTIRSADAMLKLAVQYSAATLYKRGTDEWVLAGDLSA